MTKSEWKENVVEELQEFFPNENITGLVVRRRKTSSASIDLDNPDSLPDEDVSMKRRRASSISIDLNIDSPDDHNQILAAGYRRRSIALDETGNEDSEHFPATTYRMRLSVEELPESPKTLEKKSLSIASTATNHSDDKKLKPFSKEQGALSLLVKLRQCGENTSEFQDPVISCYWRDMIRKHKQSYKIRRRVSDFVQKRADDSSSLFGRPLGYSMKMKEGKNRLLPFVRNNLQRQFFDIFTAEMTGGSSDIHKMFGKNYFDLSDVHLECSSSMRKRRGLLDRTKFPKEDTKRSAVPAKSQRSRLFLTRVPPTPSTFFSSLKTGSALIDVGNLAQPSPRRSTSSRQRPNTISPFSSGQKLPQIIEEDSPTGLIKSTSDHYLLGNIKNSRKYSKPSQEDPTPSLINRHSMGKPFEPMQFEDEEDEDDIFISAPEFKRNMSVGIESKKSRLFERFDPQTPHARPASTGFVLDELPAAMCSVDFDDQDEYPEDMRLRRTLTPGAFGNNMRGDRLSLPYMGNPSNRKNTNKFKVLEQKLKAGAMASFVIIFNETTTLKIKITPVIENEQTDQLEQLLNEYPDERARKSSINATSVSSFEDRLSSSNGKYMIVSTRPLMFARDPIKNRLFEYSLNFVQDYFWFDTLQRFLELVSDVYSDMTAFHTHLLKEFHADKKAATLLPVDEARILPELNIPCNIGSWKFTTRAPLFGSQFEILNLEPEAENLEHISPTPGFRLVTEGPTRQSLSSISKIKLPTRGKNMELSSSLANSVSAYRAFLHSNVIQ